MPTYSYNQESPSADTMSNLYKFLTGSAQRIEKNSGEWRHSLDIQVNPKIIDRFNNIKIFDDDDTELYCAIRNSIYGNYYFENRKISEIKTGLASLGNSFLACPDNFTIDGETVRAYIFQCRTIPNDIDYYFASEKYFNVSEDEKQLYAQTWTNASGSSGSGKMYCANGVSTAGTWNWTSVNKDGIYYNRTNGNNAEMPYYLITNATGWNLYVDNQPWNF